MLETIEIRPEQHPYIDKLKGVVSRAERSIQKEMMSTHQDWLTCYVSNLNAVTQWLDMALETKELSPDEAAKYTSRLQEPSIHVANLRMQQREDGHSLSRQGQEDLLHRLDVTEELVPK
jgi:superoxide dismutase